MRLALATAVAVAVLAGSAPAHAADCTTYPGDAAAKPAIAAWMAYGAAARGVPGELPVMAALVESGLTNLPPGSSDTAGYFQMRQAIWDRAPYAGYPDNPQLQLNWFVDRALAELASHRLTDPSYGASESRYGEWVADVERPAEQLRDRYQLRLGEARALIGSGCIPDGTPLPETPPAGDTAAPELSLSRPRPLARLKGLQLAVGCPGEACELAVSARIALAGRAYRLRSDARTVPAGARVTLKLRFGRKLRAALVRRRDRSRHAAAQLTVRATDVAGNASSERRRLRLF